MNAIIDIILTFNILFHQCSSVSSMATMKNSPPVIVEQPQDILAELDKPMALHCRAEASSLDDLRVNWYKDGQLVTMDPNARIITEFMALHVINTMPQDAGAYYCVAENSHGRVQSRIAQVQFLKLDKDFLVSPISTTVSVGERVRLRCEPPHGSPNPIVYWTKNGKNLSLPLDHYDLVIPSIQTTDFGSYRCIAFNGLVRQSSIAHLTEFHRPKILINPSTSRVDVELGKSIQFQCQVEMTNTDEQHQIEWRYGHRNGKLLTKTNQFNIASVEYDHSGIYVCVVILNSGRKRHTFSEEILLTVYERLINNNEEILFSQTSLSAHAGRSTIIDCQLPMTLDDKISWSIINRTDISIENSQRFEFMDKNQYRLKIRRVEEFDNQLLFECYYQQRRSSSQGLIKLHVERIEPPPIITYVPNNQTVPIGVEVNFPCQTKHETQVQWWFTSNTTRTHKSIRIENNKKYFIEANHDLIIRHVDKNDAGTYKCIVTNVNDDEASWVAYLTVEDPRSNAIFNRVERNDLPLPSTQPLAIAMNSNSIELAWNHPSTDIQGYLIEYIHLNSDEKNLQWKRIYTNNKNSRQIINDLKTSSTYQFLVRARNSFGYGQPSLLSELIETRNEQQVNDDIIHLLDPINIQETSVTIQWNILKQNVFIDRYSISIVSDRDTSERIDTVINKNNLTTYTLTNLRPGTDYSIFILPSNSLTHVIARPSNTILIRTLEGIPSSSPMHVTVELTSLTSLSIRWSPPLDFEQNGRIVAYKVNCLGSNESSSIRLFNISADAKGLHIKSLIENMQYCVSVAARTSVGYGPYSQPLCVTMNAEFLKLSTHLNSYNLKRRLHEIISQPQFLVLIIISSILLICILFYAFWLCFHRLIRQHRHGIKFVGSNSSSSSSSSSNQFVEMPIQKTLSNGTRYDLIKETPPPASSTALWTDTISSGIRLQCCTTTTASASSQCDHDPHLINIHKNPINTLLQQSKQQQQQQLNPYATTGIFQHNHSPHQPTATLLPTYSESIRSPPTLPSHHYMFDQQPVSSVQYQPPWLDHPSPSFQYRSQSHTPYLNHHHCCMHCTSQSHPHTPSSIRTTTRQLPNISHPTNSQHILNNDIRWQNEKALNSSPIVKRQSQYAPPPQIPPPPSSANPVMTKSLGGETMTTSWASSTNASNCESVSSSSSSSATDKDEQRKMINENSRSSSEGSLFSDSDQQKNVLSLPSLRDNERRPTFLMPTV